MKLLLAAVIAVLAWLIASWWAFRVQADDPYAVAFGHRVG